VAALLAASLALAVPAISRAHFLWITADPEKPSTHAVAFLSEVPAPDLPSLLKVISAAKYSTGGGELPVKLEGDVYRAECSARVVDGECDLGVMKKGEAAMRLLYTGRLQRGALPADAPEKADLLRVAFVEREGKGPAVRVRFLGKPAAEAEVKFFPEDGDPIVLKTDSEGWVEVPGLDAGEAGLYAKWIDATPGKAGEKEYADNRYYATLTLAPADAVAAAGVAKTEPPKARTFAKLPEAITSFGAAVAGDHLYVYSGHIGKSHKYHVGTSSTHFRRLDLRNPGEWEELPAGPALQGVALVAHEGQLYRVGGMAVRNQEGEASDLVSVADVAKFDPETKSWTDLPALPEPRSTHDAVVLGDRLYVVGGWLMPGGDANGSSWHEDALVLDLKNPENGWQNLPTPPFQRRALAVATDGARIFTIGGLSEANQISREVDIFDPKSGTWSKGPEIPGGKTQGFGPSAFGVEGCVFACGADGVLLRLTPAGDAWEPVGQYEHGRLMGRLLPGPDGDMIFVGGSVKMQGTDSIEAVPLSVDATR
jgi:hypothetical protein